MSNKTILFLFSFLILFLVIQNCKDLLSSGNNDLPDLVIESISINPENPNTSDSIHVKVVVKNTGEKSSKATTIIVKFEADKNPLIISIPKIKSKQTHTIEFSTLFKTAKDYNIEIIIDEEDKINEENEKNNIFKHKLTIVETVIPDLEITSFTISPIEPTTNDSVNFYVVVTNNSGLVSADPSMLRIKVGGESTPPQYEVPELSSGSSFTVQRTMLLPIALTYLAIATTDYGNDIIEYDETNNIDSLIFRINPPPRPDLEIASFYITPSTPTVNDSITFHATVRNISVLVPADPSILKIKVGGESMPPEFDIPILSPGEAFTVQRKMLLPIALTYLAIATIDPYNYLIETNESNNVDSLIFSVSPPPRSDLRVTGFDISPVSPNTKDTITFSVMVRNMGEGTANPSRVSVKVGGEGVPPKYDIPELTVGSRHVVQRKMVLPFSLTYLAKATADCDHQVIETDETNNVTELIFSVIPAPKPDLIVSSFSVNPSRPTTDETAVFTTVIQNIGDRPSVASKVSIRIGGEGIPPEYSVPALAAGASYTVRRHQVIAVAQGYIAEAIADCDSQVDEESELNNNRQITFHVDPAPKPDLIVSSFSIIPSRPTTDETAVFTTVIQNIGDRPSVASKVSIRIGGEGIPPEYSVPALAAGASYTVRRHQVITVAQGYIAEAIADCDSQVDEESELNNNRQITFHVDEAEKPDLETIELYKLPVSPTTQDSITFTATIKNSSTATAGTSKAAITIEGENEYPIFDIPSLSVSSIYTITRTVRLSQAASYTARAIADHDDDIVESNENNNNYEIKFEVNEIQKPDLIIDSFTMSPLKPDTKDEIEFNIKVKNSSLINCAPCTGGFLIVGDKSPTTFEIPKLNAGDFYEITIDRTLSQAKSYTARVGADINYDINESNELNNTDEIEFSVVQ